MAITKTIEPISFEKKVVERTKAIFIETPLGEQPKIRVVREFVTYHDDVAQPDKPAKEFEMTMADLEVLGKLSIMGEIAYICDEVSKNK